MPVRGPPPRRWRRGGGSLTPTRACRCSCAVGLPWPPGLTVDRPGAGSAGRCRALAGQPDDPGRPSPPDPLLAHLASAPMLAPGPRGVDSDVPGLTVPHSGPAAQPEWTVAVSSAALGLLDVAAAAAVGSGRRVAWSTGAGSARCVGSAPGGGVDDGSATATATGGARRRRGGGLAVSGWAGVGVGVGVAVPVGFGGGARLWWSGSASARRLGWVVGPAGSGWHDRAGHRADHPGGGVQPGPADDRDLDDVAGGRAPAPSCRCRCTCRRGGSSSSCCPRRRRAGRPGAARSAHGAAPGGAVLVAGDPGQVAVVGAEPVRRPHQAGAVEPVRPLLRPLVRVAELGERVPDRGQRPRVRRPCR